MVPSLRYYFWMVTALLFVSLQAFSQPITMEQTLDYINGKLGANIQVEVIKGIIVARFNDGATAYREDQVSVKQLNPASITYDEQNGILSIDCNSKGDCVERQLFIRRITRDYDRLSFPVRLDAKSVAGMKNAFTHLMRLVANPKYENEQPFEQ